MKMKINEILNRYYGNNIEFGVVVEPFIEMEADCYNGGFDEYGI